jgi:hypothetical protein
MQESAAMETTAYTNDEIVQRGEESYQRDLRPDVEEGNFGKYLLVDIETGEYEIGDDLLEAAHRAQAKHADAVLYALRIGYPAVDHIGGSWLRPPRILTYTAGPDAVC